jgi:DNA-binding transcriptional LysR family regulator
MLCASRSFLASWPRWSDVTHPRQLADVPCILTPPIGVWEFELGAVSHGFTPKRLGATVDDLALGAVAVRRGLGLGYLPYGLVAEDLDRELVCLDIAGWRPRPRELYALYPAARQLSTKVRAIIDFALAARANHA